VITSQQFRRLCTSLENPAEVWRKRFDLKEGYVITCVRKTPGGHWVVEQFEYDDDAVLIGPRLLWSSCVFTRRALATHVAAQRHAYLAGNLWAVK